MDNQFDELVNLKRLSRWDKLSMSNELRALICAKKLRIGMMKLAELAPVLTRCYSSTCAANLVMQKATRIILCRHRYNCFFSRRERPNHYVISTVVCSVACLFPSRSQMHSFWQSGPLQLPFSDVFYFVSCPGPWIRYLSEVSSVGRCYSPRSFRSLSNTNAMKLKTLNCLDSPLGVGIHPPLDVWLWRSFIRFESIPCLPGIPSSTKLVTKLKNSMNQRSMEVETLRVGWKLMMVGQTISLVMKTSLTTPRKTKNIFIVILDGWLARSCPVKPSVASHTTPENTPA